MNRTAGSAGVQVEHVDVLIVGAGISGIGAAYYLQKRPPRPQPTRSSRRASATGGTWDLFRYPGIRSDSDLHTFGYEFKPWRDEHAIAGADKILAYIRETATENGIDEQHPLPPQGAAARRGQRRRPAGRSTSRRPTPSELRAVQRRLDLHAPAATTATTQGFTPEFPGRDRFAGQIVHPQHWPEDLDYAGKRVVVIGSGATAVTLVPAMAGTAAHVTMLQRSPTYIMPVPSKDAIANTAKRLLGDERGYALAAAQEHRSNSVRSTSSARRFPGRGRKLIRQLNAKQLPEGYPRRRALQPALQPVGPAAVRGARRRPVQGDPRRQGLGRHRPDRDLHRDGHPSCSPGQHLDADIIVTATGLNLQLFGGMALSVDGEPVDFADTVAYKGMMLSGVPNFAFAVGYTNSSWTLKVGLLCEHFCRLLTHMDANGYDTARAEVADPDMAARPLLDFSAGYVQRAVHLLPKQGDGAPWLMSSSYYNDVKLLRSDSVVNPNLRFEDSSRVAALSAVAVPA